MNCKTGYYIGRSQCTFHTCKKFVHMFICKHVFLSKVDDNDRDHYGAKIMRIW